MVKYNVDVLSLDQITPEIISEFHSLKIDLIHQASVNGVLVSIRITPSFEDPSRLRKISLGIVGKKFDNQHKLITGCKKLILDTR